MAKQMVAKLRRYCYRPSDDKAGDSEKRTRRQGRSFDGVLNGFTHIFGLDISNYRAPELKGVDGGRSYRICRDYDFGGVLDKRTNVSILYSPRKLRGRQRGR